MYKFKVEIVLDEQRIIDDDKYEVEGLYNGIRKMFARFNLPEIKTDEPYHFYFTDNGIPQNYGALWRVILDLYYTDWFRKYTVKYIWHNTDNTYEDIMKEFKRCLNPTRKDLDNA